MLTQADIDALSTFCSKYPTWWYKIIVCDITRDFDCAPQGRSPEIKYVKVFRDGAGRVHRNIWDMGFSCNSEGTVADAINQVMEDIKTQIISEEK